MNATDFKATDIRIGDTVEVRSGPSAYAAGEVTEVSDHGFYFKSVGHTTTLIEWEQDVHVRILHRAEPDPDQILAFQDLLNSIGQPTEGKHRSEMAEYLVRNGARLPRDKVEGVRRLHGVVGGKPESDAEPLLEAADTDDRA